MAPDPNSPIRHFRADSPFIKSESAGVAQMYGRLHNYEAEEGISPQILRKQAKENFGKSQQAILCAKQILFCTNRPHTAPGGAVCRGTAGGFFLAPAVSGRNVTG